MAEPFLGEIRLFAFNRIPKGWLPCNGQLLSVNSNQALYSLIGATYGGDGRTTFALPNLQGRVPVHQGAGINYGTAGGEATHTLTVNEMPQHTHTAYADTANATQASPQNNTWGTVSDESIYAQSGNVTMNVAALSSAGQSAAHNNMQPYLALSFCIATSGIYPSRN
ncbi:tail fiber protein [Metasolibacillus meyeri]|uniref:Tail fiber protein n=1 Tax=Metasolibacillus meyeri TaxID=1071052 RepID=A0AAW9NPQ7_9BACL|nr:tail fiber protein [Metasolibacillus meyeri]MEC1179520.1 tail fiber protein [Metasolibacillus meyeri]